MSSILLLPLEEYLVFFLLATFTATLFFRSPLLPGLLFLLLWTPTVLLQHQQQPYNNDLPHYASNHHHSQHANIGMVNNTIPLILHRQTGEDKTDILFVSRSDHLLHMWLSGLYAAGIGLFLGAALAHAMDLPMLVDGTLFPAHPHAQRRAIPEVFLALLFVTIWVLAGMPMALWHAGRWLLLVGLSLFSLVFLLWLLNSHHDAFTKRQNAKYLLLLLFFVWTPLAVNLLLAHYVYDTAGTTALYNSRPWRLLLQLPLVVLLARLFYLAAGHLALRCSPGLTWMHRDGFLQQGRAPDRMQHEYVALLASLTLATVHMLFLLLYWLLNSVVVVVVSNSIAASRSPNIGDDNALMVHLHVMAVAALLIALNAWLVAAQRHHVWISLRHEHHDEEAARHGPGSFIGSSRDSHSHSHQQHMTGWIALMARLDNFRREQRGDWADLQPILCCGGNEGKEENIDEYHNVDNGDERSNLREVVHIANTTGPASAFMIRAGRDLNMPQTSLLDNRTGGGGDGSHERIAHPLRLPQVKPPPQHVMQAGHVISNEQWHQ